ncbi:MAG: 1-deoxy-D-xylulose-5-phosphate reductoisomerase [Planctomycetes bacterium]|nr:1-deoxy-D-xylulose-5-phosphate reductoisomerase [Planctomycetota bacterium]
MSGIKKQLAENQRNQIQNVAVLGATGSIGHSTLDVLSHLSDRFRIALLSCHQRLDRFQEQCDRFKPRRAIVTGPRNAEVDAWLQKTDGCSETVREVGTTRLIEAIESDEIDIVVAAIVGCAGLESSLAAALAGKRLGLANKESLVVAGEMLINAVRSGGAELLPIDSEHSAIFQSIQSGQGKSEVQRIILTASGGPLRKWPVGDLENATVEDALAHPTWNMGRKITVDSATMMNKALEVIEAKWLFDLTPEQITVVIHPQSTIHSMVEFCDGSVIAQLSPPDMRLPIQYALTYPDRFPSPAYKIDWGTPHQMEWYPVDPERYPALELGFEVAKRGGTTGAVLNGANEAAVELFLNRKIRLTEIAKICRSVLNHHDYSPSPALDELMRLDRWSREEVFRWINIPC